MIGDAVRQHYRAVWGEPSRDASFNVAGCEVEVMKWDQRRNPEGVNLYATVSCGNLKPVIKHRHELFLGLIPAVDDVAWPLAMAAVQPWLGGTEIGHGHFVTFQEPLWQGCRMPSLLVLRQREELIPVLALPDETHVEFLQVVPAFAEEVRFANQHGALALVELWAEKGVEFWRADRPGWSPLAS